MLKVFILYSFEKCQTTTPVNCQVTDRRDMLYYANSIFKTVDEFTIYIIWHITVICSKSISYNIRTAVEIKHNKND